MDAFKRGVLTLQRVHLRLKRSIVQEGKHVSLVAVCACPALFCAPVPFSGPVLDAKIIPSKVQQLRNIPYGGLAVEVLGELVPVRAALLLLLAGESCEQTARAGTVEVRLTAALDGCHGIVPGGAVCASVVVAEGQQHRLAFNATDLLLAQVTNAVFDAQGILSEICCTDVQLVPPPEDSQRDPGEAFAEELGAVHALIAQVRLTGKKRNFSSAATSLDEYFTPAKRRVCAALQSPPTSQGASAEKSSA